MDKKPKPKKPMGKKKAAKKPLNGNQYEDFHKVLAGLVTPVVPDKQ